jgi:hypothetical protein
MKAQSTGTAPMTAGFLACLCCGGNRLALINVTQEEIPPGAGIFIECLDCDHQFVVDLAQATEQVHLGFYVSQCPVGCSDAH